MTETNTTDQREKAAFDLVAGIYQKMRDRAIELSRLSNVKNVAIQFQPLQNLGSTIIDGYVDVILRDGSSVTWFVDVTWTDESWLIEAKFSERLVAEDSIDDSYSLTEANFDNLAKVLYDTLEKLLQRMPVVLRLGD